MTENGLAVWVAPLAILLGWDAWLIRHGHPSMSSHAGHHPAVTGVLVGYLAAHLLGGGSRFGRLDPLGMAARRIERK